PREPRHPLSFSSFPAPCPLGLLLLRQRFLNRLANEHHSRGTHLETLARRPKRQGLVLWGQCLPMHREVKESPERAGAPSEVPPSCEEQASAAAAPAM